MSQPRVSVICIFFNAERFFAEAIDSVLAQEGIPFELLLVDDGSNDASTQMALEYAGRHPGMVHYLEHEGHANRGMSEARNLGLASARGEYVAFIDSDDRWRQGKLAEQAAILDDSPQVGMVCGTVNYWSSWDGGEDRPVATGCLGDATLHPPETTLALYPLGKADAPCPSDIMVRRALAEEVGGFERNFTGLYEDQAFFAKVFLSAPVRFSGRTWIDYRQHPASCTSSSITTGRYREMRGRFLDWFGAYLERNEPRHREEIAKALLRARRKLDHPRIVRIEDALRRLAGRASRAA